MDTSFWGRDGWKLLHTIAYHYNEEYESKYRMFFNSIKHVLPCIYCRRSYKKYIEANPLPPLTKRSLTKWLYKIHNLVNKKLRDQGYNLHPDPTLDEVDQMYSRKRCITYDFIYCILFNYNNDTSETRRKGFITFFNALKYILPSPSCELYKEYIEKNSLEDCFEKARETHSLVCVKKWVHGLEKYMNNKCLSFKECCDRIEVYRVDKCRGETCRNKI